MSQRTTSRRAFTLIEMLLVVAIISLLIAILLPSLNSARSNARTMVCQANQRQLAHAAIAYSNGNRGKMFPYDNYGGLYYETFWMTLIDQYTGDMDQLRMCPETVCTPEAQNGPVGAGWGTVKGAWGMPWTGGWGFLGKNYGSYGWNAWMHSGRTDYIKSGSPATGAAAEDDRRHWKNLKHCATAGKTPFFSDMIWVDTWFTNKPGGASPPPANLFAENTGAGRVCIDRHRRGVVHGYVDGSAGWTRLEDLWQLTWNTESTPMDAPWALPAQ